MSESNSVKETLDKAAGGRSLSNLAPAAGSKFRKKRLGFGNGSGLGKTCGKGQKGQKCRSGYSSKGGFEGGQMPLHRRLPKIGFTSRQRVLGKNIFYTLPLKRLAESDLAGEVKIATLVERGLLPSENVRVKILGGSEINRAVSVEVHAISASAKAAIEKAGGSVRLIGSET